MFSIENGEQAPQFFPNVQMTLREFGASGLTNDQGLFRIQLPVNVLSGQEVTLRHDKKGYAICFPLLGKQLIPADLTRPVEIRMLPEGSKLFWTHERIEEFIARTAGESAKKPPGRPGEATDLSAYILELGRHNGFTADEVRQEIGKWMEVARKDVTDFRRQGMVAFAEKNFRLAGENFRRSAEEMEQQAAKNLRASAADRELSGDAFFNARDYRQALQQYRHTLTLLKTYKDSLGPLGIKTYPEHTVDVQRITFKSANAKRGLGEQVAGPDSRRLPRGSRPGVSGANRPGSQILRSPAMGHDPEQPGHRALGPGRAVGRSGGSAAAERGGGGLPPGPHRPHPRRPAPGLGHDPEQPGHSRSGPWASGWAVRRVCGG